MYNKKIDEKLHIETTGIVGYYADLHHNRYEPTDYRVLDAILELGLIDDQSVVVDYGCGKGRVDLYFSYKTHCECIGIEYNFDVYSNALKNLESSKMKNVSFLQMDACDYEIDKNSNVFYFFNPFSVSILKTVMNKIRDSYYALNRDIFLIFYYPNDETVSYLMNMDELILEEMIDTNYIFHSNSLQERVLIFTFLNYE